MKKVGIFVRTFYAHFLLLGSVFEVLKYRLPSIHYTDETVSKTVSTPLLDFLFTY